MNAILESLKFDPVIFVAEIVLFLVLIQVLDRLFWRPVLAHVRGRDDVVRDAYARVEAARVEMQRLRGDYQERIAAIEADARSRINAAIKEAQAERERLIAEARAGSDEAMRTGALAIEQERLAALASMHAEIGSLAVQAAGKAMGGAGSEQSIRAAVGKVLGNG